MSTQQNDPSAAKDACTNPTPQAPAPDAGKPHSVYTTAQKRWMVFMASVAALFSPMTASIYFPVLHTLSEDYNVSLTLINLTVTTYLIFQGLAPTFVGGFSDDAGRRPAYMICGVVYTAANIGLAVQKSYPALLVLRMVQSAGSSGTIALANAVVTDLVTSAERGSYIGYASMPSILGPALSPVIGGLFSQYQGWRWIFWFLTIFALTFFVPFLLFFPETCRKIVGDGSIPPPPLNHNLLTYLRERKRWKEEPEVLKKELESRPSPPRLRFPNPLRVLNLIFSKLTGIILMSGGLLFCCFYVVSTSISSQFGALYGFNDLQISLVFLPFGVGSLISAFTTGKIIDWNYRRYAKRLNFPMERNRQHDLTNFPIERARLEVSIPLLYLSAFSIIAYGWALEAKAHVAVPIVILFVVGYSIIAAFNTMNILMVDICPGIPASATAASNLIRCLLGAAATAALEPLIEAIGIGWAGTLFAGIWLMYSPLVLMLMKKGPIWRKEAKERKEKQKKEAEAKKGDVEASAVSHGGRQINEGEKGETGSVTSQER